MAGSRIKGITIDINGNTVGLQKALQEVNGESRSLQGQLSDVNRLLKFNPGNVKLLGQQQQILTSQIETTRKKLDELKKAEQEVEKQFQRGDISQKQYQGFQREIIATEGRLNHFKSQLSNVDQELKNTGKSASKLGSDFKKAFDEAKAAQGNTFNQMKTAGTVVTGFGAAVAGAFGFGVKAAGEQQQQMAALETAFQGNTKAAQEYYQWAQAYGKNTPFETSDVVDATIKLKSYGINAKDTLTDIGNMAAGMGKPLDQAIEAVADAQTGELERLKEFGITKKMLIDQAAKMGKNEVVNAKGQITDQAAMNDAMFALMQQRFKGGMERQSRTIQGQVSALKDSITQILQALGNALMPVITPIINFIQKLADGFNNLPGPLKTFIALSGALIGVLALIIGPILLLIGFLPAIAAGFGMISGPALAIVGIVAAVIAAIVGLVAIFTSLYRSNSAFRDNVQSIWLSIQTIFQTTLTFIKGIVQIVMTNIMVFIRGILTQIQSFWKQNGAMILQATQNVWSVISTIIQVAMTVISTIMHIIWPLIKSLIVSTWNAIKNVIQGALKVIMSIIQIFGALFTGNWGKLWDGIKGLLTGSLQLIWGLINLYFVGRLLGPLKSFGSLAGGLIRGAWNLIKSIFMGTINAIKSVITGGFRFYVSVAKAQMNFISSVVRGAWNIIRSIFSSVINVIRSIVSSGFNGVRSIISGVMRAIRGFISSAWNGAKAVVSSAVNGIRNIVRNVFNGLRNVVSSAMHSVGSAIKNGWNSAMSFLKGINLFSIGKNIIKGLINGIGSMVGAISNKIKSIAGNITGGMKKVLGIHSPSRVMRDEVGKMLGAGLTEGMTDSLGSIGQAANQMASASIPEVPDTSSVLGGSGISDSQSIAKLLTAQLDMAQQQIDLLMKLLLKNNDVNIDLDALETYFSRRQAKRYNAAFYMGG